MRRRLLLLSVIIISLAISGCIDSTTKVTVNGDGSGIITETMGMSKEIIKQMQQMIPVEEGRVVSEEDFFKKKDFIEKAAEYGQDVKLIDFKISSNDKSVYAQAVFEFDDVAKIRIKQGDTPDMGGAQGSGQDEKFVTFSFNKLGNNPTLKIMIPREDSIEADKAAVQAQVKKPSAAEAAMMKQMFAGMHFAGLIEVNGKITSTNAQYVSGSTITLFDVEFDKILDKPEVLAQLQATQSSQQAQAIFKGLDGMMIETNKEIEITFTPAVGVAAAASLDEVLASSMISSPLDLSFNTIYAFMGGMAIVMLIPLVLVSLLCVWFFARILRKAGFSPAPAFLLLIPVVNGLVVLALLMILAFIDWPIYEKLAAVSSQMNKVDDERVLPEPTTAVEDLEIKIDDTAAFSKRAEATNAEVGGVPLPNVSNRTMGSLDSDKLQQEKPPKRESQEKTTDGDQIILSSSYLAGEKPAEEPKKEELLSQQSSIEPVKAGENKPSKIIEIPDVEAGEPKDESGGFSEEEPKKEDLPPKQDVVEPKNPSMPEINEEDLKMPDLNSEDELKLPDISEDKPKPAADNEEEIDKDKDNPVV